MKFFKANSVTDLLCLAILAVSIVIFSIIVINHAVPWFFVAIYWGLNSFKNTLEFDDRIKTYEQ